jgi:hypothetical protein
MANADMTSSTGAVPSHLESTSESEKDDFTTCSCAIDSAWWTSCFPLEHGHRDLFATLTTCHNKQPRVPLGYA